ncbi:MAG TPA: uracil-DNA glycosylase [Terriglobia bacterium]
MTHNAEPLQTLKRRVIACTRCPRLVAYCRRVAQEKRRMYRDQDYWGKPLPGFGDPEAELLLVGLAPAAHGGNRTGRMFTGDRSGDFLYRALYGSGWANQPVSRDREDGLELHGCFITAAIRCAPPANKPLPEEIRRCRPWLEAELELLKRMRAVLALGRIAFEAYLSTVYRAESFPARGSFRFGHGVSYALPDGLPRLFAAYHPSQQNTQTGRLTRAMMAAVLDEIRRFLAPP